MLRLKRFTLPSLLIISMIRIGCSEKAVPPVADSITDPKEREQIKKLIEDAGEPADPPIHDTYSAQSVPFDSTIGNEPWTCTRENVSIQNATDKFPIFDPNAEIFWPGAALQGKTIQSPSPDRVLTKRGRGTVTITNITGTSVSSIDVDEVTQSNVLTAANKIISQQPSSFPANLTVGIDYIRSDEELAVKLGASASFFGIFSASASFSYKDVSSRSVFLARLNQTFYTLVFQRPSTLSEFFDPSVKEDDLKPFVGLGNPPVYVSSMTYGRIFYLLIGCNESRDTAEASLSASFIIGGFNGQGKHMSALRGLRIKAFALGGDAAKALTATNSGVQGLNAFLAELALGGTITTAKPLGYALRSVKSDKLLKLGYAYDYEVPDCSPQYPGISVRFDNNGIPLGSPVTIRIDGLVHSLTDGQTLCINPINLNPDSLFVYGGLPLQNWSGKSIQRGSGYTIKTVLPFVYTLTRTGKATCN